MTSLNDVSNEDLVSLTNFVKDEEKLVELMFEAIQGTKLEAMMPTVLKAIPLQDLQLLCVHELRGMSKKRITSIIKGNPLSDSSGSSSSESEDEEQSPSKSSKAKLDANGKPMEILELEMRARLIEKRLQDDEGKVVVKEEPKSDRSYSRSRSRSYSRSVSYSRSRSASYSRSRSSYSSHDDRRNKKRDRKEISSGSSSEGDSRSKKKKKSKITRKEFEDRMKKAKENRSYRKRKNSEDAEEKKMYREAENETFEAAHKKIKKENLDDSEREEGEIDSCEEGEAISSDESRGRGRSRKKSKHSSKQKKKSKKSTRVDKNLIHATLNSQKNSEDPSRHRDQPATETVDSAEDFDSLEVFEPVQPFTEVIDLDENKPGAESGPLGGKMSFSFSKKYQSNVVQGTDMEFGRKSTSSYKLTNVHKNPFDEPPQRRSKEDQPKIVISSDSESEKGVKKGNETADVTDENDLKLIEETVMMQDILSEINNEDQSSPVVKQESIDNTAEKSFFESSSASSNQNTDFQIKQEILESPPQSDQTDINPVVDSIKSEPFYDDSSNHNVISDENNYQRNTTIPHSEISLTQSVIPEIMSPENQNDELMNQSASQNSDKMVEPEQKQTETDCAETGSVVRDETSSPIKFNNQSNLSASENIEDSIPESENIAKENEEVEEKNEEVTDELNDEGIDDGLVDLNDDEQKFLENIESEEENARSNLNSNVASPLQEVENQTPSLSDSNGNTPLNTEVIQDEDSQNLMEDVAVEEEQEEAPELVDLPPEEAPELVQLPLEEAESLSNPAEKQPTADNEEAPNASADWSTRWLQSEKVQKVVSNSRMLSRMRKKIKKGKITSKTALKGVDSPSDTKLGEVEEGSNQGESVPVIASMEEYKRVLQQAKEASAATEEQIVATPPDTTIDLSSDESSQDDELWSKMLGST